MSVMRSSSLDHAVIQILLSGKKGSGKSSSGNTILGTRKFKVQKRKKKNEVEVFEETTQIGGKEVHVIECPDLLDPDLSEEKLEELKEQLLSRCSAGLSAVLITVPLEKPLGNENETLDYIKCLFGPEVQKYIMILFTREDELDGLDQTIQKYLQNHADLQRLVTECGGQFHCFNNKKIVKGQVQGLFQKIEAILVENGGTFAMAEIKTNDVKDLRIVLLGVPGAGKSSTGNMILGRDAFKESRTTETEIQRGRVEDRNISIIDTPGLFNTHLTDEELHQQMMRSLDLSDPGPHVFLLIINLETFRKEKRNIVEQIQHYFGKEALPFTTVLFIGRERFSKSNLKQIIESEKAQKLLNYFKGRFQIINNKSECDSNQIIKLLMSIEKIVENNVGENYNEIYVRKVIEQQDRVKNEEQRPREEEEILKQEQVKNYSEMDPYEDINVISEEELKDLKRLILDQDLPTAVNTIKEYLDQQDRVELNIGVTGESGSGKSTFVNAFRGLGDEDDGSAQTSPLETTMKPEFYLHPKYKNVKVWDLPGIGTPNFKANEYLKLVQIERYDLFIITSDRFREWHTQLVTEIIRMGKTFYFVRSRIDQIIESEKTKKSFDQNKMLDNIREDCEKKLKEIGVRDPAVFLISCRQLNRFDFNLLQQRLEEELTQHKKRVLILALPNITMEIIKKKKKALAKDIAKVSFLSAFMAAVPVPGLSVAVDLVILKQQIQLYYSAFGLDDKSLQKLSEVSGKSIDDLKSVMKFPLSTGIKNHSIVTMLGSAALLAGVASMDVAENTAEFFVSTIPIIGSAAAGVMSYKAVSMMLKKILNDIAEDAKNVFKASLET